MSWLINAAQLDTFRKNQKALIIFDASWHMPSAQRNARAEFLTKHIIDAHFFPLEEFVVENSTLPHTALLDLDLIEKKVSALGVKNDYKIIFYDNSDLHSACRALWLFKLFGHNPQLLYILDGGFAAWEKYKGKTSSGEAAVSPKIYTAKIQERYLCRLAKMKTQYQNTQVIDVRNAARFAGAPEARPGLRCGHIPQSISFPYTTLFEKDAYWKPVEKIRQQMHSVAIDLNQPIITSCGSGMTAAILDFTLDILNHAEHSLYDGSWSEWGAENLYPGETTLAERPVATCLEDL